jgi:hypothetical protein
MIEKTITFIFKKGRTMKNKLCISIITLCIITLSRNSIAGYESTTKQERLERSSRVDDAYLTSRQEDRERLENVDDAFLTENQEEIERMNRVNDAYTTSAEERAERN